MKHNNPIKTAETPSSSRPIRYDRWAMRAAVEYFGTPPAGDVLQEAQCRHLAHIIWMNRKPESDLGLTTMKH